MPVAAGSCLTFAGRYRRTRNCAETLLTHGQLDCPATDIRTRQAEQRTAVRGAVLAGWCRSLRPVAVRPVNARPARTSPWGRPGRCCRRAWRGSRAPGASARRSGLRRPGGRRAVRRSCRAPAPAAAARPRPCRRMPGCPATLPQLRWEVPQARHLAALSNRPSSPLRGRLSALRCTAPDARGARPPGGRPHLTTRPRIPSPAACRRKPLRTRRQPSLADDRA